MILFYTGVAGPGANPTLDDMYLERKKVFVDLLRWNVPVINDTFEVDEFDTVNAIYLIKLDDDGQHLGSFRLLPSSGPHILGSLFADLCRNAVPTADNIFEISRGCLSPRLRAVERLQVRNELISAAVLFALLHGTRAFTCVADANWMTQILSLGWDCELLGEPRDVSGVATGALLIPISSQTIAQLRSSKTYVDTNLFPGSAVHRLAA